MKRQMAVAVLCLGVTAACDKKDAPPDQAVRVEPQNAPVGQQGTPPVHADAAGAEGEAQRLFSQRCTLCHGVDGRGKGPAAATLTPAPRDYSDAKWQAGITDEQLSKTIVEGGAAVGKSMMMPPNPDLKDKPEVVAQLVKIIRGFKK